jgi:hypothetical protein
MPMKRTSLFLDEALLKQLHLAAKRRGVSVALLVREAVALYLTESGTATRVPSLAGRYASGKTDTAARVDELLWSDPHA